MNTRRLPREFYLQPTLDVSKMLLGKFLVHEYRGRKLSGMIVETEAYIGPADKASHAYGGKKTDRNQIEYLIGGHIYIYLVYGLYWQFNITTAYHDQPECVLIRALEPVEGIDLMKKYRQTTAIENLTSGPGKLCQALKLDRNCYGHDLCARGAKVYVEDRGIKIPKKPICCGPRVGIDYAGPRWSKIPWRFWLADHPHVSG